MFIWYVVPLRVTVRAGISKSFRDIRGFLAGRAAGRGGHAGRNRRAPDPSLYGAEPNALTKHVFRN